MLRTGRQRQHHPRPWRSRNFYYAGIYIEANSNNNVIAGNYIGSVGAGGQLLGTTVDTGIWVDRCQPTTRIGGSTAADRNVLTGHTVDPPSWSMPTAPPPWATSCRATGSA